MRVALACGAAVFALATRAAAQQTVSVYDRACLLTHRECRAECRTPAACRRCDRARRQCLGGRDRPAPVQITASTEAYAPPPPPDSHPVRGRLTVPAGSQFPFAVRPPPVANPPQPEVTADVSAVDADGANPDAVGASLRAQLQGPTRCFAEELRYTPALVWHRRYRFVILHTGHLHVTSSDLSGDEVGGCVFRALSEIQFPASMQGRGRYQLTLSARPVPSAAR